MPEAPVESTEPGPRCPPQAKGGPKPSGPGPDSGVQIRVFPAARDTAGHGATVQTCQKVIGTRAGQTEGHRSCPKMRCLTCSLSVYII